jgi:hypothetical protein
MIPSGAAGTRKTLSLMRQLVNTGKKSPVVRQLAVNLTKGLAQKDWKSEIDSLYSFVRDRIRYVKDINGVETLHTVEKILENAAGDCDDKSILLASLLESLSHKTRLVAIGFRRGTFCHVYPEVFHNNTWIPLETTEPVRMGWKPRNIINSLILNITPDNGPLDGLAGKRVDAYLAAKGAELQNAYAVAELPEASVEDIEKAEKLRVSYEAEMVAYGQGAAKKKKSLMSRLVAAKEKQFKALSKVSPSQKAHHQSAERKKKMQELKFEAMKLQAQKPSDERDKRLNEISEAMQLAAKKEKKYLKQGKIVALIVSIVVGIFTFGGGAVAVQGAYQALKAGAIEIAKKLLIGAALSAAAKGASAGDVKKAKQAAEDLEKYPPDPSLSTFDAMMEDSQMKKQAATEKTVAALIPAGIIAAFTFLS